LIGYNPVCHQGTERHDVFAFDPGDLRARPCRQPPVGRGAAGPAAWPPGAPAAPAGRKRGGLGGGGGCRLRRARRAP